MTRLCHLTLCAAMTATSVWCAVALLTTGSIACDVPRADHSSDGPSTPPLELVAVMTRSSEDGPWSYSSGLLVTSNRVLACRHAIDGCSTALVRAADGQRRVVQHVLAHDATRDLVLLEFTPDVDATPQIAFAEDPAVGASIVACHIDTETLMVVRVEGKVSEISPLGLSGRTVRTDIAARPGWSGGVLLDEGGALAGFITDLKRCGTTYCAAGLSASCIEDFLAGPVAPRTVIEWNARYSDFLSADGRERRFKARDLDLRGEHAEAISLLEGLVDEVADAGPRGRAHYLNLAALYFDVGEHEKAIDTYQQWLVHDPDDCGAIYMLYTAFHWAGRAEDAERERVRLRRLLKKGACDCG